MPRLYKIGKSWMMDVPSKYGTLTLAAGQYEVALWLALHPEEEQ